MNLTEIRQKYPQYDNLSDEQLVIGLHKKYYPQMDFNDFAQRVGYRATPEQMLEFSPEALAQIEAGNRAYDDKSHMGWNVVGDALSGAGEGVLSGTGRLASGVTFGASDWLDRKIGGNLAALDDRLQRRADAAGLGLANKIAKAGTEIVGNVAPSAAITRGLTKVGVKSALGQAAAGGGIGGALYGATASDKLSDLPVNTIAGGVGGTVGGAALHSAISGIGTVGGLFRNNLKKGMDYIRKTKGDEYLQNMIDEATQKGVSLAEVADRRGLKMVESAKLQTPAADDIVYQNVETINRNIPERNNEFINKTFGYKSGRTMTKEAEEQAINEARPYYEGLNGRDFDPNYKPESKVNISGKLSKEQADELLKSEMQKVAGENAPTKEQLAKQNFDRWFEGSQVVDENGNPLKVYHGTEADFDAFDMSKGRSTADIQGAFFSPYEIDAKGYGSKLKEVYLNIKNPADEQTAYKALRKYQGQNDAGLKAKIDLQNQGYDGVFNGYDEYIAFEPNQIKSVNNSGGWSSSADLYDRNWNPKNTQLNIISNTPKPQTTGIGDYVNKNPFIKNEISNVRKDLTWSEGVRNAPDTSFDILNAVKKNIDDKINVAKRAGNNEEMARLVNIKNELVGKMDAVAPEYAEARKIYENAYRFEEASNMADDIFNSKISSEEFEDAFSKMTGNEKQALKGGIRDKLVEIIENRANESLGWNRVIPQEVQTKIRTALGDKQGDKIIAYANAQLKAMRNLNKVVGGSPTAERQSFRDNVSTAVQALEKPTGTIGIMLRRAPWNDARNMGIARIMTNPSADLARATYEQVASPRGWEAVYQALYNPRGFTRYNTALAAYLAGRELQQ